MCRIGNSSAAAYMAVSARDVAGAPAPMPADVTIALAPTRESAATIYCLRQSSGSGAAIRRAQDAEQRDHAVRGVGELHRHYGVGRQVQAPQLAGERRYRAVGLRKSQPTRRRAADARAIRWIDQRERGAAPHAGAVEQIVKRGMFAACLFHIV
jgi:hypothetical protein